MEEEAGEFFPVKALTSLALVHSDLGSGQTDGQERRGNREFFRSITPKHTHSSGHHCDLWGCRERKPITEWAAFLSPQPFEGQGSAETQRIWDEPEAKHG